MNFDFLKNEDIVFLDEQYTTVQNVADFYDVPKKTIETAILRNREILDKYGYTVLNYDELKEYKERIGVVLNSKVRTITLLNRECLVIIAYLLSKTEKTLRMIGLNDINNHKFHEDLLQLYTQNDYVKKYEKELGFLIHSVFDKFHKIEEQVRCGKYLIDFVIDNTIAIECDEYGHSHYSQKKEQKREEYIKGCGYSILRYDTRKNNMLGFIGEISNFLCANNLSTNSAF